jgi:hypothetical protein
VILDLKVYKALLGLLVQPVQQEILEQLEQQETQDQLVRLGQLVPKV